MLRLQCICAKAASKNSARCFSTSERLDQSKNWLSRVMTGPDQMDQSGGQFSASHSSQLADKEALYELCTHTAKPGESKHYSETYEEYAKLLEKRDLGVKLIGSWRVMIGEANEQVHLWKHKNGFATADKLLDAQISDKEIAELLDQQSKLCVRRKNTLMLKFSFWDAPAPRPPKHIYELRSYILQPGQMIEWGNNWARGIQYRKEHNQAVGGFFTQMGRLNMVFHLWAYKDLMTRKRIREETWQKPGWDLNVMYTVPLIRRMRSRIMAPNSFSLMQ